MCVCVSSACAASLCCRWPCSAPDESRRSDTRGRSPITSEYVILRDLQIIQTLDVSLTLVVFVCRAHRGLGLRPGLSECSSPHSWTRTAALSPPHRCVCLRRSGSLLVPQPVQQVAAAYVSITTLLLSAHDVWEQADQIGLRGSGETGSEVTASLSQTHETVGYG